MLTPICIGENEQTRKEYFREYVLYNYRSMYYIKYLQIKFLLNNQNVLLIIRTPENVQEIHRNKNPVEFTPLLFFDW